MQYIFLDEIQRLPRWELYLKKAYDLKLPVRFVISGSASSPIFRSSQESLLGRIKDRHLLPFSFREFCLFRLKDQADFSSIIADHLKLRPLLLEGKGKESWALIRDLHVNLQKFGKQIDQLVLTYCREGGFPEVWELPDSVRKIEYLMEQQIRKVLYEDLTTIIQYRKPENVLRFFVYLLAHPGVELNLSTISKDIGIDRRVIEENLPRLEYTDMIMRVRKFVHQPVRVRQGNIKCYPVDMALRNAVFKTWDIPDETIMGLFAENLVVRELNTWPEKIEITYYREKDQEVDFVVAYGGNNFLPIEVKPHRREKFTSLKKFCTQFHAPFGVVITREREVWQDEFLFIPLRYFLLTI